MKKITNNCFGTVILQKELTRLNCGEFKESVLDLHGKGFTDIRVDFQSVDFVDATGIGQ